MSDYPNPTPPQAPPGPPGWPDRNGNPVPPPPFGQPTYGAPLPPQGMPGRGYPAAQWPYPQAGYATTPTPPRRRGSVRRTMLWIRLAIVAGVLLLGGVGLAVRAHNASVNGQTTDGALVAGDCLVETAVDVKSADCSGTHTGKVSKVLAPGATTGCPAGQEIVPLTDPTTKVEVGVACIDTSDHS